jgi:hypothetical protein
MLFPYKLLLTIIKLDYNTDVPLLTEELRLFEA